MLKAIVCWVILSTGHEMCLAPRPLPIAELMYSDLVRAQTVRVSAITNIRLLEEGTPEYEDAQRRAQ